MSAVTAIYHILIKYGAFTYALRDKEIRDGCQLH